MTAIFKDSEYNIIETPAAKSFSKIKREAMARASNSVYYETRSKEHLDKRAYQYACAMNGIEYHHYSYVRIIDSEVNIKTTGKGNKRRVTEVTLYNAGIKRENIKYPIPHWDFEPTVLDLSE